MDLVDRLRLNAQQVEKLRGSIQTEEATKTAFIMPFIQALGYDVFNPMEVHPEYTADLPERKGEKVDYAIIYDDKPIMLIECKHCNENLDHPKHRSQLHRYFHVTETKIAVLTNGILYRFYTDTDKDNVMDDKPFFEFDMLNFEESSVNELKRFTKTHFNSDELGDIAKSLLYTKEIKRVVADELNNPSPELVKYFISHVYSGMKTTTVVEKFTEITKRSLKEYIDDRIKERLGLNPPPPSEPPLQSNGVNDTVKDEDTNEGESVTPDGGTGIITTAEELEAFYIVKSILREVVDTAKIQYKDTNSYFGINLNGSVRQTICRLRFNEKTGSKKIGIIDNVDGKKEATTTLENLDQIYGLAEFLKARVKYITQDSYASQPETAEML